MTELIDNPPPLPEPAKKEPWQSSGQGAWIRDVNVFYTADQYRAGEAAAFARGVAAGRNAGLEVSVSVGDFTISPGIEEGRVWIARKSGEGGDFRIARLEEVIRKFYEEDF